MAERGVGPGPRPVRRRQPVASLTIAPATAQLVAGGSPQSFSASQTGPSAPRSWSLEGPGKLSVTSGAMTVYTPPASVLAGTQAHLRVSSGTLSAEAMIVLTPASTITVAGRVLDLLQQPLPDITVALGGQIATTDQAGQFTIPDVTVPYTLTAFSVARNAAVVYEGLTRSDPTIAWPEGTFQPSHQARVAGIFTSGAAAASGVVATVVVWSSAAGQIQERTTASSYVLPVDWNGGTSLDGALHALQIAALVDGIPTSFPGSGGR